MLPGQIGLLILGLLSAAALTLMIVFSVKTHKREERIAAHRAAREKAHQAMQAAQAEEPLQEPIRTDKSSAVRLDPPEPPTDFEFKF